MTYEYTRSLPSNAPVENPHLEIGPLKIPIWIACLIWGVMMFAGLLVTIDYQWHPTTTSKTPEQWPLASPISGPRDQSVMLMFLHPHCPCSRSSLAELANLAKQVPTHPTIKILFLESSDFSVPVEQTAAWRAASAIPQATVQHDQDGKLSRLFGASSSGTLVLYDKTGRLQFAGGITAGRGHSGTNPGIEALTACLNGAGGSRRVFPVFGCPISKIPLAADRSTQ